MNEKCQFSLKWNFSWMKLSEWKPDKWNKVFITYYLPITKLESKKSKFKYYYGPILVIIPLDFRVNRFQTDSTIC